MEKKVSFIRTIQFWGIVCLIGMAISFAVIDTFDTWRNYNRRLTSMRENHIAAQKAMIKQEVQQVVARIARIKQKSETLARKKIKSRVYEAYAIAENMFKQYEHVKPSHEIQDMIIEALRPIRFEAGTGYYFMTQMDGIEVLFADKPELEGKDLLHSKNAGTRTVIQDMIEIARTSQEGFYAYQWTKPGMAENRYPKISYIKRFAPFDWFIGTGIYVDDVEAQIKQELLDAISRIRFGTDGYIFVNRFNGEALVSNGKVFSGHRKLWEIFDSHAGMAKAIFEKEYEAALKPDGGFINYTWLKLTDANTTSPKVSFIYGIPEFNWLVGAGVYLDNIERDIGLLQARLAGQIKTKMMSFALMALIILAVFLSLFKTMGRRLENDFNFFISFFNRAAVSDAPIERDGIRFQELDRIASYINGMIEERKQAEKILKDTEKKYSMAMDAIRDGVWDWDVASDKVMYNPSCAKILGETEVPQHYSAWHERIHPEDKKKSRASLRAHLEGQSDFWACEHRLKTKQGEWKWVLGRGRVVEWAADGKPLRMVGTMTDISERKAAETRLKKSEAQYRLLADHSSDVIFVLTMALNYRYVSPSVKNLGGYAPEDIMGKASSKTLTHDSWLIANNALSDILDSLRTNGDLGVSDVILELEMVRKDSTTVWTEVTFSIIVNERGRPEGILGVARNIDERKKAEAEKEQLQNRLIQAEKMEAVGRLAGGVAHDFNNMLSIILGNTELLFEDLPPVLPSAASSLEEIQKAALQSSHLTRQLLAFARKQTVAPKVLDLNNTIAGMIKMLRRLIGEQIELSWHPGTGLWPVKIDPSQVDQMLANLCVNARDSIKDIGHIGIETGCMVFDEAYCKAHSGFMPGQYVMLAVSDDGCGMDKDVMDNLFEPFFTTKGVGEGTGLGLATVYGIVRQNKGFINVYSEPAQGTVFRVYLPRHERQTGLSPDRERNPQIRSGHETILLVEDETAILTMTTRMLERLGYRVLSASAPEDALRISQEVDPIDLLLTDVIMPGMNGRDLAEILLLSHPDMKCLFMSGYTADLIAHHGVLDDGLNFISKPFSSHDLSEKLRHILDGTAA